MFLVFILIIVLLTLVEISFRNKERFDNYDLQHQGALTNAFLDTNQGTNRFCNRIDSINNYLSKSNFKQIPLLSVSKPNLVHWILYDNQIELII